MGGTYFVNPFVRNVQLQQLDYTELFRHYAENELKIKSFELCDECIYFVTKTVIFVHKDPAVK